MPGGLSIGVMLGVGLLLHRLSKWGERSYFEMPHELKMQEMRLGSEASGAKRQMETSQELYKMLAEQGRETMSALSIEAGKGRALSKEMGLIGVLGNITSSLAGQGGGVQIPRAPQPAGREAISPTSLLSLLKVT